MLAIFHFKIEVKEVILGGQTDVNCNDRMGGLHTVQPGRYISMFNLGTCNTARAICCQPYIL